MRLRKHGLLLLLAGVVAFAVGAFMGGRHQPSEQRAADRFVQAWARNDLAGMYALLSGGAKDRTTLGAFEQAYREDAATATMLRLRPGRARSPRDGVVEVPLTISTKVFGTVATTLELPFTGEGEEARVDWGRRLAFPGVRKGERLTRRTTLPTRATILAADGTKLAAGPDRLSDAPDVSGSILGALGPIPEDRAAALRAEGVPADAQVGVSGLERALDDRVRGRPGGVLLAGGRELVRSAANPADPVKSTIVPSVQRAAVTALAGRLGGIVAMHPRTGRVLAAAGIGFSGLQPPGSTFKIITLAGALEAKVAKPSDSFAPVSYATLEGVKLANANNEVCGGSLVASFAHSCNSVFGPLGAKLGAKRLVETAEQFGFNRPTGIEGAATSTIPPADEIGDDLAVGSSAIGQGRVQATALQMAIVAATIGERGMRPRPTLNMGDEPQRTRAVPPGIAARVGRAMRQVVVDGTGVAAQIPGVKVAGKTGTAELRSTQPGPDGTLPVPTEDTTEDTDAWFASYAPAGKPRIAVGVLLVSAGAGGDTAAPAARTVLLAGLKR